MRESWGTPRSARLPLRAPAPTSWAAPMMLPLLSRPIFSSTFGASSTECLTSRLWYFTSP